MIKKLSILASSLVLFASAHAGLDTSVATFTTTPDATDFTITGSLDLFNSTGKVLTGAKLYLSGSMESTLDIASQQRGDNTFQGIVEVLLKFGNTSIFGPSGFGLFLNDSGTALLGENEQATFALADAKGPIEFDVFAYGAALSAAGGGTFDLSCASTTSLTVSGGNSSSGQDTFASCGASIQYTFRDVVDPDPGNNVPEPSSLALVGLALAGMGVVSRRRRPV